MRIFTSLKSELLGILHNRKLLIAVIGVMTIPLLYSGTYLWAFWDPYGHLDRLPVAVVNNDKGADYQGEKLKIGADLVKELKNKKSFNWKFVSEKTADEGLDNQEYYLKVEIPKDFSQNATTLQSKEPKKLNLIYTANEGYNYLSSKIGDSAMEKIKEEISSSVTKTYAKSVFKNIKDVAQGLTKAGAGAGDLSSGIDTAKSGASDLQSGIGSAKSGAVDLNNGASQVNSGASDLYAGTLKTNSGAISLANGLNSAAANMPELQSGSKQLADGASQLSSSMDQWNQGALAAKQGALGVSQGLQQTEALVSQIAAESDPDQKAQLMAVLQSSLGKLYEGSQGVVNGVGQLSDNADLIKQKAGEMAAGAGQLNAGQNQLAGGLNQLATGAVQLENGTNQLTQGSKQLADGTSQLFDGMKNLNSGMSLLSDGSNSLTSGMSELSSGSKELADQLQTGAKDAGDVKADNNVYDMFSKPVNLKDSRINHVPDYGTGFAPYFLSLSLFVGALVLSVIFPMVDPAAEPKSGLSWFTGKLGILLIVGLAQALLADFVLLKVLGLEVKSVPLFIMITIFTSWTFFAIIQFFVAVLDNPGRFLAIIILVLQLTSSAGTYPIELSPVFLQRIAHFMPMTYSVAGFRAIISTGNFSFMWKNIGFESIFLIVFIAATLTFFILKYKRQDSLIHALRKA